MLYMASGIIEYSWPISAMWQDTNGHISHFLNENSSNDLRSRFETVAMTRHGPLPFFFLDLERTANIQLP